ncbi:hypothetical protein E2C01_101178 [Portunus trituberculatus]|uniref:Uncharacterized protein n=1 Tax=Portunus trituberculatus TaxID=210409 RepID=A0A5B7KF63_PORTR|nr:hypothetical protein [Portunus trituberculatus]
MSGRVRLCLTEHLPVVVLRWPDTSNISHVHRRPTDPQPDTPALCNTIRGRAGRLARPVATTDTQVDAAVFKVDVILMSTQVMGGGQTRRLLEGRLRGAHAQGGGPGYGVGGR